MKFELIKLALNAAEIIDIKSAYDSLDAHINAT